MNDSMKKESSPSSVRLQQGGEGRGGEGGREEGEEGEEEA